MVQPIHEEMTEDVNVEDLFTSSQDSGMSPDGVVAYDCQQCGISMSTLEECYPPEERKDGLIFHCQKCYLANKELLSEIGTLSDRDRAKKKQEVEAFKNANKKPVAKTKKPAGSNRKTPRTKKKTTVKTTTFTYNLFARVWSKYPGFEGYHKGEIYRRYKTKYSVYFPEDHTTLTGVTDADLKTPKVTEDWAKMTRKQFVGEHFMRSNVRHDIIAMGKGKTLQQYEVRVLKPNGQHGEESLFFNVGEVQQMVLHQMFPLNKEFNS